MATKTQDSMGLLELANLSSQSGVLQVAEILSVNNAWLRHATWTPANSGTVHEIAQRTSLPAGTKRQINDGSSRESGKSKKITETMEMLESISRVDAALVDMAADPRAFRAGEDQAHIEGLGQTLSTDFVSGNVATNTLSMQGLSSRLSATGQTNVISAGGSGSDTMSVYLVKWGASATNMIYPRGSTVGLMANDLGVELVDGTTSNTEFLAYRTHFKVHAGLAVRDSRHIYRIANVESAGSSNILTSTLLINALGAVNRSGGTNGVAILMNQTAFDQLTVIGTDKANVTYPMQDPFGRPVPHFQGVPIDVVDALTITENAI